jgi:predicted transcriptional regulator
MIESKYILPDQVKIKAVKNEDMRKFCVVPLRAFLNRKVSGENLRVLAILASYANKGGYSFVSLKTIAKDLGCTAANIHKHLKKLEAQGIIKSYSNYFPGLKGNTRRIIYDETIKNDDLKEYQFTNADITATLKHTKLINEVESSHIPVKVNESVNQGIDPMLVILECVKSESDLLAIEKALAGGLDAEVLKARLSSGLSVHEAINFKG